MFLPIVGISWISWLVKTEPLLTSVPEIREPTTTTSSTSAPTRFAVNFKGSVEFKVAILIISVSKPALEIVILYGPPIGKKLILKFPPIAVTVLVVLVGMWTAVITASSTLTVPLTLAVVSTLDSTDNAISKIGSKVRNFFIISS